MFPPHSQPNSLKVLCISTSPPPVQSSWNWLLASLHGNSSDCVGIFSLENPLLFFGYHPVLAFLQYSMLLPIRTLELLWLLDTTVSWFSPFWLSHFSLQAHLLPGNFSRMGQVIFSFSLGILFLDNLIPDETLETVGKLKKLHLLPNRRPRQCLYLGVSRSLNSVCPILNSA